MALNQLESERKRISNEAHDTSQRNERVTVEKVERLANAGRHDSSPPQLSEVTAARGFQMRQQVRSKLA